MKIITLKSDLAEAVANVQKAVANKAVIPALEGILIKTTNNAIQLLGYDMEIGITTEINAKVIEQGGIVVKAKLLADMVKKLPEEQVTIEANDKGIVHIQSGSAEYDVVGISTSEYPDLPALDEKENIHIDGELLKEMIRQTVYAVSDNMQKPTYTGSLFRFNNKEITIVAIDGYRMSVRKEDIAEDYDTEFIVPKKTQQELLKLIESEVNISIGLRYISFDLGDYKVISRLIEGVFLNYKQIIPKEFKTVAKVKTQDIINAVDRMSLLCGDKIQSPVKATVTDNIEFSCESTIGKATETVSPVIEGESVTVGFNNRYMIEALKNIDSDEVEMKLSGEISPIVITPLNSKSSISLVVPMRLKK